MRTYKHALYLFRVHMATPQFGATSSIIIVLRIIKFTLLTALLAVVWRSSTLSIRITPHIAALRRISSASTFLGDSRVRSCEIVRPIDEKSRSVSAETRAHAEDSTSNFAHYGKSGRIRTPEQQRIIRVVPCCANECTVSVCLLRVHHVSRRCFAP